MFEFSFSNFMNKKLFIYLIMNEMFQFFQFVHEQDRAALNLIHTQTCSDLLSEWRICSVDHITNEIEIAFHSHVLTKRDFNESKN